MIDEKLIIQPALDVIPLGSDAQLVPLAKRRSLRARAGDLMTTPVVIVEIEVVLQSIGSDHVVATLGKSEDNAAGGVLASRDGFEPHRGINVGIRPAGRDDHIESIVSGVLNQRLASL
jgi:hypothetical protein